ncbi:MAG: hypothetical protein JXR64_13585, partial [Spirochaetales bacterium]|nr:hypothetical protein [Spirochaetales bacterium]
VMIDTIKNSIYLMDDFITFKNIQIEKYNKENRYNITENSPEWDVVIELIKEYWCDLLSSGYINKKNCLQKKQIFSSVEIVFPYLHIPSRWLDGITYVDFRSFNS